MHTAVIRKIVTDVKNQYLVTGSDDKTVRVWDLQSGKLCRTIRPPIGPGVEGKIVSVAISPDGRWIACGGCTGYYWERAVSVYLFDRQTGEMINKIGGLPNVVLNVEFSKAGDYLAVTIGREKGVRIYSLPDLSLVMEDGEYQGSYTYGLDFDWKNRLVTSSYDGYIRLYDSQFNLINKAMPRRKEEPLSVKFSPDGSKIAVGYNNLVVVDVLDAKNLSRLYTPNYSNVTTNGHVGKLCWSLDNEFLFAGGQWNVEGTYPIRRWNRGGLGPYKDLRASKDTIMYLEPLLDGGLAFCSANQSFAVWDGRGEKTYQISSPLPDYRDMNNFRLSHDGDTVQFNYDSTGRSIGMFSVSTRDFMVNSPLGMTVYGPITKGLGLKNWRNSESPSVGGRIIHLEKYENSRSVAILPDKSGFVMGTDQYLRLFSRHGKELWRIPSVAIHAVNVSRDGRLVVGAYGDGTIRWHRVNDGQELLVFFPHNDQKRWVLWTPTGYYDASVGGDELIGWHINNGLDRSADFFRASKFKSVYYKPNIIDEVLTALDEDTAIRNAKEEFLINIREQPIDKMRPPVVTILSPYDNWKSDAMDVIVRFKVNSNSSKLVVGTKILIDGRPVKIENEPMKTQEEIREIKVQVPNRDCELSVVVKNQFGSSEPDTVRIQRGEERRKQDPVEYVIKPNLYILAVGVADYDDKEICLTYPAKDASDFVSVMLKQKGNLGLYRDVIYKKLVDKDATKTNILRQLEWIRRETTSKDVAVLFFSGHGMNDQIGKYYFLPVNVEKDNLMATGISYYSIQTTVESLAGKVLLFLDTCYGGNVWYTRKGVGTPNIANVVNELSSAENGAVVFTSSQHNQYSLEGKEWNNGAFTKALVEGIEGKADFMNTGRVTINMLDHYISERVKKLTDGQQAPASAKPRTISDFPIAVNQSM